MHDLHQQIEFILELDRLKAVYRKALVKVDHNRYENSAEHSWHIALAAHILAPYAEEAIQIGRVCQMLLIHDVVEIDAGDTFAFAHHEVLGQQSEKETAAAQRIFGLLPEPQRTLYLELWQEFELAETADARYAKAIDRILPLIQNMQNEGGSWVHHKVRKQQVLERNLFLKESAPRLWDYVQSQIEIANNRGWLL